MAFITPCRLCGFTCYEFKCLYEENGEISEIYKIAAKYFSSSLLNAETDSALGVICIECWQHISNFYNFQQWILNAQEQHDTKFNLNEDKPNLVEDNKPKINYSAFKCRKCDERFESQVDLNKHFEKIHPFLCDTETIDNDLKSIESRHSTKNKNRINENSFKCETCGASFSQYGNLRRHIRKKHSVQPLLKWICKYCNKMFKTRSHLERHKNKLHNNDQIDEECKTNGLEKDEEKIGYNTQFSKEEFSNDRNISSDSSVMSSKNSCKQIQMPALDIVDIKKESDEDAINIGNVINSDEFSSDTDDDFLTKWKGYFECPRCTQHINNFSQLNEHFILEHPEERCYVICCNLTLHEEQTFEEHQHFHENPNAFECADCGKCFRNRRGLRSHKLQVHSDNRSVYHLHLCYCKRAKELHAEGQQIEYDTRVCCSRKKKILEDDALISKWKKELSCGICKATFQYYSLMRVHFYHEHPGEKCYILCCQRKMSRISDALQHIRFHLDPHAYRCKACNLDFSGKNTLAKHMRNAHTDALPKHKWACDECDKTFEIRQILTRHKNVYHSKQV